MLFFVCAGDPVAKSGASAGGFVRPPDHSCLAGIEALAHSLAWSSRRDNVRFATSVRRPASASMQPARIHDEPLEC